ncbi:DJ-1/PfpI family protein [Pseudoalteromonas luteoviolacea]|uniref:DJ-1/PfpI domain-containing protein n=1 Tax=Pseudoalteromonas luteoviolacea S4060-1 TaxID=1365257 RepID=A0A162B7Z8_9GAMM|nr:DJ-1/PfpI family protein [Pseudoalteromonas luteoviolacea]KZN68074.1 hypothetical protein N478_15740 [Pseudoalteromonas luteoviolacea S4060-1]
MKKILAIWLLCLSCVQAKAHSNDENAFHVGVMLFEGAQAIDFVGPIEVFGQAGFRITTVNKDGREINTAMGLKVVPDRAFSKDLQLDALLIPGGNVNGHLLKDVAIKNWILAQSEAAQYVMSVCNGAFILANTGLLDGLNATTIEKAFTSFERQYPQVNLVRDRKLTDNGKVLTTAGLSSGIDGALSLVAKVKGERVAHSVAAKIEYQWMPDGGYIRGKMADQVLPDFGNLPSGISLLSRTFHYGDERVWYQGYRFDIGVLEIVDLSAWLAQQMAAAGWKLAGDRGALTWSFEHGDAHWLLHASMKPTSDAEVVAHLTLTRQL